MNRFYRKNFVISYLKAFTYKCPFNSLWTLAALIPLTHPKRFPTSYQLNIVETMVIPVLKKVSSEFACGEVFLCQVWSHGIGIICMYIVYPHSCVNECSKEKAHSKSISRKSYSVFAVIILSGAYKDALSSARGK